MTDKPTTERLLEQGIRHQRAGYPNPMIHTLYEIETGKVITEMTAFEAIELLERIEELEQCNTAKK